MTRYPSDYVSACMAQNFQNTIGQPGIGGSLPDQVNQAGFALDEAQLYLDTHPCDTAALEYFRQVSAMYQSAVSAYEKQFGPLMASDTSGQAYWSWISDPWPWEGGTN